MTNLTNSFNLFVASDAARDLVEELESELDDARGFRDGALTRVYSNTVLAKKMEELLDAPFAGRSSCSTSSSLLLLAEKETLANNQWAYGASLGYLPEFADTGMPWLEASLMPVTESKTQLALTTSSVPNSMLNRHYFAAHFLRAVAGDPVNLKRHDPDTMAFDTDVEYLSEHLFAWNLAPGNLCKLSLMPLPEIYAGPEAYPEDAELLLFTNQTTGCSVVLAHGVEDEDYLHLWKPNGLL